MRYARMRCGHLAVGLSIISRISGNTGDNNEYSFQSSEKLRPIIKNTQQKGNIYALSRKPGKIHRPQ